MNIHEPFCRWIKQSTLPPECHTISFPPKMMEHMLYLSCVTSFTCFHSKGKQLGQSQSDMCDSVFYFKWQKRTAAVQIIHFPMTNLFSIHTDLLVHCFEWCSKVFRLLYGNGWELCLHNTYRCRVSSTDNNWIYWAY